MIILFCGGPGSGKSTIARLLIRELRKKGTARRIISDRLSSPHYPKIFKFMRENLDKDDFLILDATFYKKKWRDEVYKIARGRRKVFLVYVTCSLKSAVERNKKRKDDVIPPAIHIIRNKMERPRRYDIRIDTDKLGPEEAVKKVLLKINERVPKLFGTW